ncbi:SPOR domain-containing protein [Sphingomonas sp. PR090111-T3T-6A]|uniref:SPOR domain-containing protein n=1 Tax=Sphingomonas sp. PR090111-T3T-6A TaxID=685778 RepID=UPI00039E2A53|nr:SPOR domain-containing protein [Sphingomonas sp. PR090111-T3T-6A]
MPILPSSGALRRFMLPVLLFAVTPVALAQLPAPTPAAQQNDDPSELLARALRTLATEPNNLEALTAAGHNALVLGDANAAVGFFGRAQEISPRDGRVKAGLGSALVQLEKPQEALRLFGEASRLGVPETDFAADRGLAYDLTGDSRKAQRDYATALAAHPADATIRRRLALSQGISGDQAAALATLDPLLRARDIAGWRDKTFVLAMTGDAKGASDITHIMMPQQADMLQPFLVRLGTLSAADKAKAVHFGEMPAAGHNYTPTQLANIGAPPTYAGSTATAPRSDLAPIKPTTPGTIVASQSSDLANAPALAPVRTTTLPPAAAPATGLTPPQVDIGMPSPAATGHYDLPHVAADRRTVGTPVYHGDSSARRASSASDEQDCTRVKVPAVRATRHHRGKPATTRLVCKASGSKSSESASSSRGKADEDCTTVRTTSKGSRHHKGHTTTKTACKARSDDGSSAKSAGKAGSRADEDCTTVKTTAKGRHHKGKATTKTVCKPRADDDATPSKTSASKAASHADEDCTTMRVRAKGRHGKATTKQVCKPRDADDSATAKASSRSTRSASADEDCTPVKSTVKGRHGKSHSVTKTVCKPAADDKATAKKGAKAASDDADDSSGKGKKATASTHKGKASDDEDDTKASAKGSRIYVQVAGGANKADMDKAWAGVKKKAPELMKGKSPSTTPLRATHRLMVGPFKDEAEAQAFVNKMSGKGLSGFVVKTTKGQKVEKVGGGE